MHLYEILKRPVVTEKSNMQAAENNQYTFEVDLRANKHQVKAAVEQIYSVHVLRVNIIKQPAKYNTLRGRRRTLRKSAWKKAVVQLAEGESITLFEGV